jgi:glycosyltransferase involved in cell wall biosynthesis
MLRQPKRPDVLAKIARQASTIRFIVCGGPSTHKSPPEYSTRIMAELRTIPNVEFLGQVAPDKTMQIIADAGSLLSTSDEEGFPNTFLEAWASGTPVVTLKVDPDSLIMRHGLGAVSGTVETAIDDLTALLDSPQHRNEIAARAQRYVAEQHSEEVITGVFAQALGLPANTTTAPHPFHLHQASTP